MTVYKKSDNYNLTHLDLSHLMAGDTLKVVSKMQLDSIVKELELYDHNGIVIAGYFPFYLSVVNKKKPTAVDFEVGKWYKNKSDSSIFLVNEINEKYFNIIQELTRYWQTISVPNRNDYVEVTPEWKEVLV